MGLQEMELSRGEIIGHHAATAAPVKDNGKSIMFRVEFHLMLKALIIEGIEDNSARPVRSVAGPSHRPLSILGRMASKVPLRDLPFRGPVEGNAHVLQLIQHAGSIPDHDLHGILVSQIVASLDRVEEMPLPVILFLIAQCRRDAPCAAPEWERVGRTLLTTATRAWPTHSTAARNPASPAPRITMSWSAFMGIAFQRNIFTGFRPAVLPDIIRVGPIKLRFGLSFGKSLLDDVSRPSGNTRNGEDRVNRSRAIPIIW